VGRRMTGTATGKSYGPGPARRTGVTGQGHRLESVGVAKLRVNPLAEAYRQGILQLMFDRNQVP
jgi:hypothetical protein